MTQTKATESTTPDAATRLSRILDNVIEELKHAPDEEFAAIMSVERENPAEVADRWNRILNSAKEQARRNILERAKKQVVEFWSKMDAARKPGQEVGDPQQRLDRLLKESPGLLDNMTLAARRGERWSEEDLRQLLEDLEILESLTNERKLD